MKKPLLLLGVLVSTGACLLWGICGTPGRAASLQGSQASAGYWNTSCVTAGDAWLVAGGDHSVLISVSTGKPLERSPGMVKAISCETGQAVVFGYDGAFALPGKAPLVPRPRVTGESLIGVTTDRAHLSWSRTLSGRRWKGPATVFVDRLEETKRIDLLPALFGAVGEARALPTPDTFAVRVGDPLDDGRVLVAAGWQPSQSEGAVEDVPWGFFAIDLATGTATPLTMPLRSDAAFNQAWVQKVAASGEAAVLAVAAHDGKQITVGTFAAGSDKPTRVTSLESRGSTSALAVEPMGSLIAVGSESRGSDSPASAWVIDQAGKVIWHEEFPKTVVGLHFLEGGSLIVTSAGAAAVHVAVPSGKVLWRFP